MPREDADFALARILREQSGSYCDQIPNDSQRYSCLIDRMLAEASKILAKHERMQSDSGIGVVAYYKLFADPSMGVREESERGTRLYLEARVLMMARCGFLLETNAQMKCGLLVLCAYYPSETERQSCLASVEEGSKESPR